jgi:4-hydroxy-3-methylbut-2-enyl diphosphate reductase
MKVTIDKSAGFCWGVVRTVDIAEAELERSDKPLYSLGEIIHNPMEIDRLEKKGLTTITHDDLQRLPGSRILIRAHGEPPETYRRAKELGIELVDATCPVVAKVQERIGKFYDKGYQVVIFGKQNHAEVIGLVGRTNGEAVAFESVEEIDKVDLSRKTVLFSQTTMDKATFHQIKVELARRINEFEVASFEQEAAEFHAKDTICGQVSGRDKKLREFAAQNEVIVFVAGRNSSNGKVLFNICREANPRTCFVQSGEELQPSWFAGVETVGISGATSTPHWLMEEIEHRVEEMSLRPVKA